MIKPSIFEAPHNYLALPEEFSTWEVAKAVILSAPYDGTTSFKTGTREGPAAIIQSSQAVELYDDELETEPAFDIGIHTLPALEPVSSCVEGMVERVAHATRYILEAGKFPVLFGGEHTVTVGAAQAIKEQYQEIGFFVIDAHADLRTSYHDSPFNHACVSRRLWEWGPVVQAGIRSLSIEEADWIKTKPAGYTSFPHRQVVNNPTLDDTIKKLPENIYISIDLDGLDPAIMPAVGTPEPGGLFWDETLTILKKVCDTKKVVGFDLVELCPIPGMVASDFLAAKLAYKLLSYVFKS